MPTSLSPTMQPAPARWATLYAEDSYSTSSRKMGRQSAGEGLLDALIKTEPSTRFTVVATRGTPTASLQQKLRAARPGLSLHFWPTDKLDQMRSVDSFYVADPLLARWAWRRQWHPQSSYAYSLIGVTHTLCSQAVGEGLRDWVSAPLEPWDALICTSHAARSAVETVLEHETHRISERFGATRTPRMPQLPVIPLGCRTDVYSALGHNRHEARKALNLSDRHFVVLFVGRLELHGKAHPGVVLQALVRFNALRKTQQNPQRAVFLVYGTAQSAAVLQAWQQLKSSFASFVDLLLLDGQDLDLGSFAWAAADVFVTMADSPQETFGLTPVEAMAAGLPVIASDWDGYRDTIVHGETGFLIPTRQPAAGSGSLLSADLMLGRIDYDAYLCQMMQQIVVEEEPLLQSLLLLGDDSELCLRMGAAGKTRAKNFYDWGLIASRYRQLAVDLALERNNSQQKSRSFAQPPLPCPWHEFSEWATSAYPESGRFSCPDPEHLLSRVRQSRSLRVYSFPHHLMVSSQRVDAVVEAVLDGATSLHELSRHPDLLHTSIPERERAVAWLTKIGALVWDL